VREDGACCMMCRPKFMPLLLKSVKNLRSSVSKVWENCYQRTNKLLMC
jgi:hypothetical protein